MVAVKAEISSISPFLIIRDLQESIDFYCACLGFNVEFLGPESDPYFAIVKRDSIMIFLKVITPEVGPVPNCKRHEWARWDAYAYTKEPEALAAEFNRRSGKTIATVEINSDDLRGFEIRDPNGYVLYFGRPNKD